MEVNISLGLSIGFWRSIHLIVHGEWNVKATKRKSLSVFLREVLWLEILYLLWPHALKINISDTCAISVIRVWGFCYCTTVML